MTVHSYFGLVGNGETAALISPDLAISWLCIPRFDGTPVFARALDPRRGGALSLRLLVDGEPVALQPERQRYLGDTALLQTTVAGSQWQVEVLDYMPWGQPCLVREVRVVNRGASAHSVCLESVIEPVSSTAFPVAVSPDGDHHFVHTEQGALCLSLEPLFRAGSADLVPPGGSRATRMLVGYGADAAAARTAHHGAAGARAERQARFWTSWIEQARQPGPATPPDWLQAYRRSLIVLKLLSYPKTGALLAAPTASFPAVPGGGDNWDYRFVWLRDGYLTAMAFDAAGLHEEAAAFYDFAFTLQAADGHWDQPLYRIDGSNPAEFVAADMEGPGGERPIRFGNAAAAQLQLDNEGSMIHGLWFHWQSNGQMAMLQRHWEGIRRACEWTAANWRRQENGIWELREYTGHWVHGKVMCYVAMESGARIADALGQSDEAARWREEAARIRSEVLVLGWSEARQAYLRHYGEQTPPPCLDVSVLALAFYGLLTPEDPRMVSTAALMEREQAEGGLRLYEGICRYDYAAVPFYLPTLWMARFHLMSGRRAECDRLIQVCLSCATDLELMAEHFDGRSRTQWGNFPQAFSHEEVVRLLLERDPDTKPSGPQQELFTPSAKLL